MTKQILSERIKKEELLMTYYDDVVHYLSVFNIEKTFLEDAVQDTFVEAFGSLDNLRDVTKMKYWLLKIAKRVGTKYVVKCKNITIKECSFEEYVVKSDCNTATFGDKQLDDLIKKMDNEELYQYIDRLKEKEQSVLLLYYVYGHTLKEIAGLIGETNSNTKSLARRGRLKLKEMLEEGGFNDEGEGL